jgi:hypothetical protein
MGSQIYLHIYSTYVHPCIWLIHDWGFTVAVLNLNKHQDWEQPENLNLRALDLFFRFLCFESGMASSTCSTLPET